MRALKLAIFLGSVALLSLSGSSLVAAQSAAFDTSGLPRPPTTFEEQQLWDEIESAQRYPELAARAHEKLAAYYERKGLSALAARERAAAVSTPPGSAPSPGTVVDPDAPGPSAVTIPLPNQGRAGESELDPRHFDLSAFPSAPTNFEEQLVIDSLRDPNTMANPVLLAFAHRQLGRYYAGRGRVDLAAGEYGRAVLANPHDHRSYQGLAALHEAVGTAPSDGNIALRDVADRLQTLGLSPDGPSEPEPQVQAPADPAQWQEVSAEFNRRMNYMYTSNAWNGVYRTVFTSLYGR